MSADNDIPKVQETADIIAMRQKWQFNGATRPDFADQPESHQESVWDFPRPPVIQPVYHNLLVTSQGKTLAETTRGVRVIETTGAPTYYFPPDDVEAALFSADSTESLCEWKGYSQPLLLDDKQAGWRYVRMFPSFVTLFMWPSFYPAQVDCFIDDEQVSPQPGGYYGGWVTTSLAGPIKGGPGTQDW